MKQKPAAPRYIQSVALSADNARWLRQESQRTDESMSAIVDKALNMLRDVRATEAPVAEVK